MAAADDSGAAEIARALVGDDITALRQLGGGRNSRVFRVESARGAFALKQYPAKLDDQRDRIGTEARALQWMEKQGVTTVPRVVAVDTARNFALLSWVDGDLVRDVGASDIDQAANFLSRLHGLRGTASAAATHLAAEACLSGAEIARQIRQRIAGLSRVPSEPELAGFLENEIRPAFITTLERARSRIAEGRLLFDADLSEERRSLVPSDFGFHNALRAQDGGLTFIDFEYFGWDDPVKLTADILLHPGTEVEKPVRDRFRDAALRIYGDDDGFPIRLAAFEPLFGLRWALILLNEFHPERWRRRVLAGTGNDWALAKTHQLARARAMLARALGDGDVG